MLAGPRHCALGISGDLQLRPDTVLEKRNRTLRTLGFGTSSSHALILTHAPVSGRTRPASYPPATRT